MPKKIAKPADNSAAIAAQFGISTKALRLYERLGMLTPPRTGGGWRVYGQAEIERLHAILSLKQLGLPLARIVELLKAGTTDLGALLSVQEAMLQEVQRETEHALTLVQIAKVRLRETGALSTEELAGVVRLISRTVLRTTPEMEKLAERIYTPEQRAKVFARNQTAEENARASRIWEDVLTGMDRLLPDGDPASEEALALGRRLVAFFRETTQGDKELWNNSYRFWQAAIDDPRIAAEVPFDRAHWDFMSKIFAELNRRGEIKP